MNKKLLARIVVISSAGVPFIASAASTIEEIFDLLKDILTNNVIPLLFVAATVVFLWGVITYITAGGDEDKSTDGKKYIIWGIIAMFAMVAIWGIVQAVSGTFGLPGSGIPTAPR